MSRKQSDFFECMAFISFFVLFPIAVFFAIEQNALLTVIFGLGSIFCFFFFIWLSSEALDW
ncbi:hypothetical protein [Sulfurisphaera ohwakuensis]|uniref:hypothetical protein n=1 Tax=Sulfurisphaera ohwakuensis TaxID=69656 RepID=UPI0036F1A256